MSREHRRNFERESRPTNRTNRRGTAEALLLLVPTTIEARLLFGSVAGERASDGPHPTKIGRRRVLLVQTGFGLAAAGASAGRWLALVAPDAALLVGCAGTFDPSVVAIGEAIVATSVELDGIGAGEGARFTPVVQADAIRLVAPRRLAIADANGELEALRGKEFRGGAALSVAAAAGSRVTAAARRRRHRSALVEEMEGYAVALAARAANVPLTMIRGACNVVGDREKRRWRVEASLAPVRAALESWVELASERVRR